MQVLNDPWPWQATLRGPLTLTELIAAKTLTPATAATFAWTITQGASVFVAAGPPGAGKSTVANALIELLPSDSAVYVTSGARDRLDLPASDGPVYLLINELSAHMPVYLSGSAATRALQLTTRGVRILGTLHARNSAEALRVMCYESRLAQPPAAPFVFGVVHAAWVGQHIERRLVEIGFLSADGEFSQLVSQSSDRLEPAAFETLAAWTGIPAAAVREQIEAHAAELHPTPFQPQTG